MAPTSEQESAVERLYENEALISNLTSDVAQPVLQWAEQQILADANAEAVYAAVRAVNQSGAQDAAAGLALAQQTLSPASAKDTAQPQVAAQVDTKQEVPPPSTASKATDAAVPAASVTEPQPPAQATTPAASPPDQTAENKPPRRKNMQSFFQGWSKWLHKNRA